jgi:hypothetical protein
MAFEACTTLQRFDDALSMFAHTPLRRFRIAAYMAACHSRRGDRAAAESCVRECFAGLPE